MPADWCALNEVPADLPHTISLTDPPVPAEMHYALARYASQNPIAAHFLRTRDGRATRFSDLITRRQLHRLDIYREVYQPLTVEYQIAFTLPSGPDRVLDVALSHAKRDFTATERDLLNLARPYLIQACRNALTSTALDRKAGPKINVAALEALGLTSREAEGCDLSRWATPIRALPPPSGSLNAPPKNTSSTATGNSVSPTAHRHHNSSGQQSDEKAVERKSVAMKRLTENQNLARRQASSCPLRQPPGASCLCTPLFVDASGERAEASVRSDSMALARFGGCS